MPASGGRAQPPKELWGILKVGSLLQKTINNYPPPLLYTALLFQIIACSSHLAKCFRNKNKILPPVVTAHIYCNTWLHHYILIKERIKENVGKPCKLREVVIPVKNFEEKGGKIYQIERNTSQETSNFRLGKFWRVMWRVRVAVASPSTLWVIPFPPVWKGRRQCLLNLSSYFILLFILRNVPFFFFFFFFFLLGVVSFIDWSLINEDNVVKSNTCRKITLALDNLFFSDVPTFLLVLLN